MIINYSLLIPNLQHKVIHAGTVEKLLWLKLNIKEFYFSYSIEKYVRFLNAIIKPKIMMFSITDSQIFFADFIIYTKNKWKTSYKFIVHTTKIKQRGYYNIIRFRRKLINEDETASNLFLGVAQQEQENNVISKI